MMSPLDIVPIPLRDGSTAYTRRVVYDMWVRAGRPPVNSAGRLKAKQQEFWDLFQAGKGSPADDPNRPTLFRLTHVRFGALDVDVQYRAAMIRAGFVYPIVYERWHAEHPDAMSFPLVTAIPASGGSKPFPTPTPTPIQEDDVDKAVLVCKIERGEEWSLVGATVPGGVKIIATQAEADAHAAIYGPAKVYSRSEYIDIQGVARARAAEWVAQQKAIHA